MEGRRTPPSRPPNPALPYREDCWSEGETSVLIDAWGDRYVELNRGNLRQKQWQEVADAVNSRPCDARRPPRTDVQCKNRVDTLKKKYKAERSKIASASATGGGGASPSQWVFYDRLDDLIGASVASAPRKKAPPPPASPPLALPLPSHRKGYPLPTAALVEDSFYRRRYSPEEEDGDSDSSFSRPSSLPLKRPRAPPPPHLTFKERSAKVPRQAKEEDEGIRELSKATKTKLLVTHHVSNVLGSVMPIDEIVVCSHDVGAKVLVDACQSVPHMAVDVQKLDADFVVASSHKMCGPTGIGFLYGKRQILSAMAPLYGSEMIADVFQDTFTSAEPSSRLETGAPAIAQAIGLGAAIDYLSSIGMQRINDYENELADYLYHSLLSIPNVRIYGPAPSEEVHRAALCSFNVEKIHPNDIATILDEQYGVAIRVGHHCAQPLHRYLGINASARASLYFYNTKEEVDIFIQALKETISFFSSYL